MSYTGKMNKHRVNVKGGNGDEDDDEKLIKEIEKTRNAIKRKYESLREKTAGSEIKFVKTYKPLIEPLVKIAGLKNPKIKREKIKHEQSFKAENNYNNTDEDDDDEDNNSLSSRKEKKEVEEEEEEEDEENEWNNDGDHFSDALATEEGGGEGEINVDENRIKPDNEFYTNNPAINTLISKAGPLGRKYIYAFYKKITDQSFGPYYDDNTFKLGNQTLTLQADDKIKVGENVYDGTSGLYELIFSTYPLSYTRDDFIIYSEIINQTSAHRIDRNPNKRIKSNKGEKYKNIIKNIEKIGGGLAKKSRKIKSNNSSLKFKSDLKVKYEPPNYIYWDEPEELVKRMQLLYSEKLAGHTGHDNEILAIIEELYECGIILNKDNNIF